MKRPAADAAVLTGAVLFYGFMALVAVGVGRWLDAPLFVLRSEARWPVWQSAGAGAGVGLAVVLISRQLTARFAWARTMNGQFREILGIPTIRQASLLAGASAVAEELAFRGLLMSLLGPWWSSLLFAAAHVAPGRVTWHWTLFAGLLGLAFAQGTLVTGDLTAAMVAHFTVNYFNLLALEEG